MDEVEIEIPINECDIEAFKELIYGKAKPFVWKFDSDTQGITVKVKFIKEDSEDD